MQSPHAILFVHLGPQLPHWLSGSLYQARIFNDCPIFVAAEARALAHAAISSSLNVTQIALEDTGISENRSIFREISPFDRAFRSGFWTFTTERFFVIESVISQLSLHNVIYLENDVLLYCDLNVLVPKLSALYPAIAATFDNDVRCVPGIMYIRGERAMTQLSNCILEELQASMLAEHSTKVNDMALLGALRSRGSDTVDHLPIVPPDYPARLRSPAGHVPSDPLSYSRHFDALQMIFDAAALGQYLGGIDPRNNPLPTKGFVNESCVFDPRIVGARMITDGSGRRIPVVETASGLHHVANLHIHSKNPQPFLSI